MLTVICKYLHNWFDSGLPKYYGEFAISDNVITKESTTLDFLAGQYVRITGSILNDGVHEYPFSDLRDETFNGALWSMAVPKAVIDLATEIENWQDKVGNSATVMSPYQSESFGGYSYSKGTSGNTGDSDSNWQTVFGARLRPWKKLPLGGG